MEKIIELSGQHFHFSKDEKLVENCSSLNNCAIIIDEDNLNNLIQNGDKIIGSNVKEIIVITNNLNPFFEKLISKNILLIKAISLNDAISRIAINSKSFTSDVVLAVADKTSILEIIDVIIVK